MEEEREDLILQILIDVDISSDSAEETSYQPDFCDSCLAPMDQRNGTFGAKPKWGAKWSDPSKEEPAFSVFSLEDYDDEDNMRATRVKRNAGPKKQNEPLLMKQPAEYNKMAKELENWTTKEQEDGEEARG